MKEIIEKYFVFSLVFIVLSAALFVFKSDGDIVKYIVGAFIGLISAPAVYPKDKLQV